MNRPRLHPALLAVALAWSTAACTGAEALNQESSACTADSACPRNMLCLQGACVNPTAQVLQDVDLLVTPVTSSGLKPQPVSALSLRQAVRRDLVLRPTLAVGVRTCFDCPGTGAGPLAGTLFLYAPQVIDGVQAVERVTLDGTTPASVGLLEFNAYDPVFFPAEPLAPLLRGPAVYASAGATLDVQLPDPSGVFVVSGRVVEDATASAPVPVAGIKVFASQGGQRLTRDVLTADDGRFVLRVLRGTASAITLSFLPGDALITAPAVDVPGINLDADRDLGDVDLGLPPERGAVSGTVMGPAGTPVAGAQVVFEGALARGTLQAAAVTDDQGRYGMLLPPGLYARAVVPPPGSDAALEERTGILVAAGATGGMVLDAQLGANPEVCGRVVDARGRNVVEARVQLVRVGNVENGNGPARTASADVRTTTSGDGTYCVRVPPGRHLLTAAPRDGSGLPQRTDLVDVPPLGLAHDVQLPRAALVVGTARGPDMQPLPLARIKAFSPTVHTPRGALELGETFTDAQGTFVLPVGDLLPTGF